MRLRPEQQLGTAAPGRQDAEFHFRQAETCIGVGDDRVGMQRELATATQRHALDRRDDGHGGVFHRLEQLLPAPDESRQPVEIVPLDEAPADYEKSFRALYAHAKYVVVNVSVFFLENPEVNFLPARFARQKTPEATHCFWTF